MAISRALMERQLRKGGGIMNVVPRKKYGWGSSFKKAFKSVTKPITKIADKIIPNEVTKAVDSLPAPVKAALYVYGPTRPFIAAANAAATLNRAQGRGLGLGDLARLGLDYAAYGSAGGIGGFQVPGFNAAGQYTGPGSQFFGGSTAVDSVDPNTGLPSGVEASEGALSTTVTDPVVTKPTFATPDRVLATGDGAAMEATYEPRFGKTVGMEVAPGTPPAPTPIEYGYDYDMGYEPIPGTSRVTADGIKITTPDQPAPLNKPGYPSVEPASQLGEVGIKTAYETAGGGLEGIKAAAKEGAADFFGVPEFKELGRAISEGDALGSLKATKDLILNNPSAVIGSASLMTYLTTPEPLPDETPELFEERKKTVDGLIARYGDQLGSDITDFDSASDFYASYRSNLGYTNPADLEFYAEGGRAGRAFGGIMDIPMGRPRDNGAGITELDYRQDGGFVPIGIKEKADDVPAMLSKNEFVMTADAVRGAGNGDIEKGAQKMYNTMKQLESRVV